MTLEEAKKLAVIALTVDNGCIVCINNFVEELNEAFSEFTWTVIDTIDSCADADSGVKVDVVLKALES